MRAAGVEAANGRDPLLHRFAAFNDQRAVSLDRQVISGEKTGRAGPDDERPLPRLTVEEARRLLAAGEFPAGSMGPKIESAVEFVAATGNRVLITDIDTLPAALAGDGGTVIVPAEEG